MRFEETRVRLHQLRAIPLDSVLAATGAQRDLHDKAKWHTDKGAISVTGMKFMNWNQGRGGGGAIDLAMHLNSLDFKAAVDWLSRHFPPRHYPQSRPLTRSLALPPPTPRNLAVVEQYLLHQRGISLSLVESLIQSGKLYADAHANAVFLLLGKENRPVGAELRGTVGPARWRGMAPGSQKDLGFFSVGAPNPPMIVLCESAIDALSCFLLHPSALCASTSGARANPQWLPFFLSQGLPVYCGFDADSTGDAMALQLIALYPAVRRLRPTHHDWNDVLKYHSTLDLPPHT
jgi:hypothetical protein